MRRHFAALAIQFYQRYTDDMAPARWITNVLVNSLQHFFQRIAVG